MGLVTDLLFFVGMLRQSDVMPVIGDDWDVYNLLIGRMLSESEHAKMSVEQIEQSLHPDFVASGPETAKKVSPLILCSSLFRILRNWRLLGPLPL